MEGKGSRNEIASSMPGSAISTLVLTGSSMFSSLFGLSVNYKGAVTSGGGPGGAEVAPKSRSNYFVRIS